jgi:hypothetical protein
MYGYDRRGGCMQRNSLPMEGIGKLKSQLRTAEVFACNHITVEAYTVPILLLKLIALIVLFIPGSLSSFKSNITQRFKLILIVEISGHTNNFFCKIMAKTSSGA